MARPQACSASRNKTLQDHLSARRHRQAGTQRRRLDGLVLRTNWLVVCDRSASAGSCGRVGTATPARSSASCLICSTPTSCTASILWHRHHRGACAVGNCRARSGSRERSRSRGGRPNVRRRPAGIPPGGASLVSLSASDVTAGSPSFRSLPTCSNLLSWLVRRRETHCATFDLGLLLDIYELVEGGMPPDGNPSVAFRIRLLPEDELPAMYQWRFVRRQLHLSWITQRLRSMRGPSADGSWRRKHSQS